MLLSGLFSVAGECAAPEALMSPLPWCSHFKNTTYNIFFIYGFSLAFTQVPHVCLIILPHALFPSFFLTSFLIIDHTSLSFTAALSFVLVSLFPLPLCEPEENVSRKTESGRGRKGRARGD